MIVPLAYSAEAAASAAKAGRQGFPLRETSGTDEGFGGHPSLPKGPSLTYRDGEKVACHPKLWTDSRAKGGGADRDRTDDLLNAIQALSQLSYGPTQVGLGDECRGKSKKQRPKSQTSKRAEW